jgi:hypothetical protein
VQKPETKFYTVTRDRVGLQAKVDYETTISGTHLLSLYYSYSHTAMGLTVSSLWGSLSRLVNWKKDEDVRILMLGLDSAGKVIIKQWYSRIRTFLTAHTPLDDNSIQVTGKFLTDSL